MAEFAIGEFQRVQRQITLRAVGHLLLGPGEEARALRLEELAQLVGAVTFDQQRFLLAEHVEIHQRQLDFRQSARLAEQPAVDLGLRPMQQAMVGRLAGEVAAEGLDLLQAVALRIVAIGPTAHGERTERAFQGDFALVAHAPARGDLGVTGDAFQRGGRGREAQVEIALLGGELAERPHGNPIVHAALSAHCT
ncbi:hypothetical protein SSTU70S_03028 [Stutzerimonas stutzeri]